MKQARPVQTATAQNGRKNPRCAGCAETRKRTSLTQRIGIRLRKHVVVLNRRKGKEPHNGKSASAGELEDGQGDCKKALIYQKAPATKTGTATSGEVECKAGRTAGLNTKNSRLSTLSAKLAAEQGNLIGQV